jgi:hypothetical protein
LLKGSSGSFGSEVLGELVRGKEDVEGGEQKMLGDSSVCRAGIAQPNVSFWLV